MLSLDRPDRPEWAEVIRRAQARQVVADLRTAETRFRLALREIAEVADAPRIARRALGRAP